jgi:hypothetical protein
VVESQPWELRYTKQALKDAKKLSSAGLKEQAISLLAILQKNPFTNPPPYNKIKTFPCFPKPLLDARSIALDYGHKNL